MAPVGHKVAGLENDGRQKKDEKSIGVEYVSFLLGQLSGIEQSAHDESQKNEETALRKIPGQLM